LDIFPASIIDRLETYKTLIPGMPADAIGGLMNIVTQEVPSQPIFNARVATGYNTTFFMKNTEVPTMQTTMILRKIIYRSAM
jgi:hypothetical protein